VNDNQDSVRVRVSQGESKQFSDNTLLGELVLSGLRGARRGEVKVEVSFALDASGLLNVDAKDTDTGRSISAQMRLVGLGDSAAVDAMRARHMAAPMG
jgi:molecular chaperone DnaK